MFSPLEHLRCSASSNMWICGGMDACRPHPAGRHVRGAFRAADETAGFLTFAVVGAFLTLIPTYGANLTGSKNLLLGGAAVGLTLARSTLTRLAGYRRRARTTCCPASTGSRYPGVGLHVIGVGFLATVAEFLSAVQYFAGIVAVPCCA
jgi:hypothetical protein